MSVPRLSFREKPLRMPRVVQRSQRTQQPQPPPPPPNPVDIESQVEVPVKKNYMWIVVVVVVLLFFRLWSMPRAVHTIKTLNCVQEKYTLSCRGARQGTFIVEASETCSQSIYDIGGYPFSVAMVGKYFKVPANKLTVSGVRGQCDIRAYVDSSPMTLHVPFTWITTAQHTEFTLKDGDDVIVDRVSASLFQSVSRGNWIAYTYDIPGTTAQVIGDGTDVIYLYGVV